MKKTVILCLIIFLLSLFSGCQSGTEACEIAATTLPVYEFTSTLCQGTDLKVCQIVTQNVSCLHDYTLQSSQMRLVEGADTVIINGGGLEDFLTDVLSGKNTVIDTSEHITLECAEESHDHNHSHHHDHDPHIWLSPANAIMMAENICEGLSKQYPQYADLFSDNLTDLTARLQALQLYGEETLSSLSCRELITFHDGFSYFAQAFDLTILKAIEEDSGSEASASELKEIVTLIDEHSLPAIFTETNGSTSSAKTVCAETGASLFSLDMAMSGSGYFDAMYHNIDTIKEALG